MTIGTDQDWVRLLQEGNQEAMQELWEKIAQWSTMTVRRKYGDDEDIAQDAAVDAYQRILKYGLKNYDNRGSFLGYCRITAVHEVYRRLKQQKGPGLPIDDVPEKDLPPTLDIHLSSELPYDLEKCLERLDSNKRQVMVSLYFDEESPEIVASKLQTTRGNIYVLKKRSLEILFNCLKSKGHNDWTSVLAS